VPSKRVAAVQVIHRWCHRAGHRRFGPEAAAGRTAIKDRLADATGSILTAALAAPVAQQAARDRYRHPRRRDPQARPRPMSYAFGTPTAY
jgi:hypothetical protein